MTARITTAPEIIARVDGTSFVTSATSTGLSTGSIAAIRQHSSAGQFVFASPYRAYGIPSWNTPKNSRHNMSAVLNYSYLDSKIDVWIFLAQSTID